MRLAVVLTAYSGLDHHVPNDYSLKVSFDDRPPHLIKQSLDLSLERVKVHVENWKEDEDDVDMIVKLPSDEAGSACLS